MFVQSIFKLKNVAYMKEEFSFSSKHFVLVVLFVGLIFLINTYQKVLFFVTPENEEVFKYPFALRVVLAHVDGLFFGLATICIMFQSGISKNMKALYCVFEAVFIALSLNIYSFAGAKVMLTLYLAIFGGFTFYYLGMLAVNDGALSKFVDPVAAPKPKPKSNLILDTTPLKNSKIGFDFSQNVSKSDLDLLSKYPSVVSCLNQGMTVRQTAKFCKIAPGTVQKVRKALVSPLA